MKIFVQIASYRDPELVNTIEDMLAKAKKPKNLVLAIARQYANEDGFDNLDKWKKDKRFRILDIPYEDSNGACWARNLVQQLYDGEEYTLQIDSHMRFNQDWDDTLIKMLKDLQKKGYKKPLLTSYACSFEPTNDPAGRVQEPWRMVFDRFSPEGNVFFNPETIPNWQNLNSPIPARFYSAHYCFTLGQFSREVQHNPEFYFHGEEISIGVRAYTWGYDLFHPHFPIIYHEYTRKGKKKQWDDDTAWGGKNERAHFLNKRLFGVDGVEQEGHDGLFGFGLVRTLRDYEKYAGILFSKRSVQQQTIDKLDPPVTEVYNTQEDWLNSFSVVFKHCIDVGYHLVPEKDYNFWVVAYHDENDETIFRKDADKGEIASMMSDPDGYCKIWRDFQTTKQPKYWVVWPYSASKGWCERLTGELNIG
jgi:hypothetical protein